MRTAGAGANDGLCASDASEIRISRHKGGHCSRSTANEDGLDGDSLFFEIAFDHCDADGKLTVPRKANNDQPYGSFLLGVKRNGYGQKEEH
jgi:hypothetical protein